LRVCPLRPGSGRFGDECALRPCGGDDQQDAKGGAMKNILWSFGLVFLSINIFGQNVKVLEKNSDYQKQRKVDAFEFIDYGFDNNKIERIAVLKGEALLSGKATLSNLFQSFRDTANSLGANSFLIAHTAKFADTLSITILVYSMDEQAMKANFDLYPRNMVYVFGDYNKGEGSGRTIKLNKQKIELLPMEYVACQNKVGEYISVGIGGFLGSKTEILGTEDRLPLFLSLSGFGVGPGGSYNNMGISFHTGRIYPVEMNFGQFLINILTEKPDIVLDN
jgi:hypothetical protein